MLSRVFWALGGASFLLALVVNPWAGALYRRSIVNHLDVMAGFFAWAMGIGVVFCGLALWVRRKGQALPQGPLVLLIATLLLVLMDRFVLAALGLPLWVADADRHYAHRENAVRTWDFLPGAKEIRINEHGFHDDSFAEKPEKNEVRGLFLGDSITMGHGLPHELAFANLLERQLTSKDQKRRTFQMINAGVQGYATHQEYHTLKKALRFEPDFVVVGFCMNDLTEPFVVNQELGGTGLDYHGVVQSSSWVMSTLMNETGLGRLAQKVRRFGQQREEARLIEIHSVKKASRASPDASEFSAGWELVLSHLEKMHAVAQDKKIPFVLLVFPYAFQLGDSDQQEIQRHLVSWAKGRGITTLDFTPTFESLISGSRRSKAAASRFFLDHIHLTPDGHQVVANRLFAHLAPIFEVIPEPHPEKRPEITNGAPQKNDPRQKAGAGENPSQEKRKKDSQGVASQRP
jgi:lysophospholipase L1-like esterase